MLINPSTGQHDTTGIAAGTTGNYYVKLGERKKGKCLMEKRGVELMNPTDYAEEEGLSPVSTQNGSSVVELDDEGIPVLGMMRKSLGEPVITVRHLSKSTSLPQQ